MERWVCVILAAAALGLAVPVSTRMGVMLGSPADTSDRNSSDDRDTRPHTPENDSVKPIYDDIAADAGVEFVHQPGAIGEFWLPEVMGAGGAILDYDGDGDYDIYVVQGGEIVGDNDRFRNKLFANDGLGRFTDVSAASGADVPGYGMGAWAADYDNDGDVDLFITRLGPNVLLRNNGDGTFTDVSDVAGVADERWGTGAAFFDFDRDGFLDLFVTNYVDWKPHIEPACYMPTGQRDYCTPETAAASPGVLYHNLGDGRFEDVSAQAGISRTRGNGLGVLCSDFDGDGWVDVFVANDMTPGFFWHNKGDGTFEESGALRGCAYNGDGLAIAGMGVAAEDIDADGDFDLVVTNIGAQPHMCLDNEDGYFSDVSHSMGFGRWGVPYTGFGIALFDQNHDARLDGLVVNGAVNGRFTPQRAGNRYAQRNQFIRRDETGRFIDATEELGVPSDKFEISRGAYVVDIDNDGDLDMLVTNNRGPVQLLRNENQSGLSWVMLDLIPGNGNRHAINARVELEVGDRRILREVRPHESYLGTRDPRIHVGLADAQLIDRLTVRWSDGAVEEWVSLPVDRHLRLVQGHAPDFGTEEK